MLVAREMRRVRLTGWGNYMQIGCYQSFWHLNAFISLRVCKPVMCCMYKRHTSSGSCLTLQRWVFSLIKGICANFLHVMEEKIETFSSLCLPRMGLPLPKQGHSFMILKVMLMSWNHFCFCAPLRYQLMKTQSAETGLFCYRYFRDWASLPFTCVLVLLPFVFSDCLYFL